MLQLDGRQVALEPWTSCYGNMCSDGMPVPPFEDAGDRDLVPFSFPLKGWTFEATFTPSAEGECERAITVPAEKTGDYTFAIPAAGPPGAYDVNVFGQRPGRRRGHDVRVGDLGQRRRCRSRVATWDSSPTTVTATIAYPVELGLQDLATTPRSATATVTVTAADGATKTYGPFTPEKGCFGVGQVFFREPGNGGGGRSTSGRRRSTTGSR